MALARLRTPTSLDLIAVNNEGIVSALNISDGVPLWTVRSLNQKRAIRNPLPFVLMRSRAGLDNVVVFPQTSAVMLDGRTGREIWRVALPATAASATAIEDVAEAHIFVVDNSLQKIFILDTEGRISNNVLQPNPAVGAPAAIEYLTSRAIMVALNDGRLEIFDPTGKLIGSAHAGDVATTAPLFVRTARRNLLIVGTRSGLKALAADDLKPLGTVTIKGDSPRGDLLAKDLDGDGVAEVVMFTEHGRLVVVRSEDGNILWDADAQYAETATFFDVNSDGVIDVVTASREYFAAAFSGRDGTLLWEEKAPLSVVANHSTIFDARPVLMAPGPGGTLVIDPDLFHNGLRAVGLNSLLAPRHK